MTLDGKVRVGASIAVAPAPDERAFVDKESLWDSLDRIERLGGIGAYPVPRGASFLAFVLYRVAEEATKDNPGGLSGPELIALMMRRELREWFTLHPRWAWLHRRLNTRRWRFARDGSF